MKGSFCLVLKDCLTCCNSKEFSPSGHISAENEFCPQSEAINVNLSRSHRASSVQRQTDSLRRMGQLRCVTPKPNISAPTYPYDTEYYPEPDINVGSGDGGPILMLPDEISPDPDYPAQQALPAYRSYDRDPLLDSLPRPVPPPYSGSPRRSKVEQELEHDEDKGTYLV